MDLCIGFVLCRYVFFDIHGIMGLPVWLFVVGMVSMAISFFLEGKTTPIFTALAYIIGFIAGALFMGLISLIAGISNTIGSPKVEEMNLPQAQKSANVAVIAPDAPAVNDSIPVVSEEKYEIKSGDTLDKIVYRFYGKYDVQKIEAIQQLNNITNPSSLQIGQVILIPVDSAR